MIGTCGMGSPFTNFNPWMMPRSACDCWCPPPFYPQAPPVSWEYPPYFNSYGGPLREVPRDEPRRTGPWSGNAGARAQVDQLRYQQHLFNRATEPSQDLSRTPSQLTSSTQVLLDNFEKFDTAAGQGGGQDGIIGLQDLEAMVADPHSDAALKKAARFMLNNPALRNAVDGANGTGNDQRFNREELEKSLQAFASHEDVVPRDITNWDDKRCASVLSKWVRVLDGAAGGAVDGKFGRDDLQAVFDSPDASWELKVAAFKVLGSETLAHRLDSGNGAMDGVYADADLQRVMV